MGTAAFGYFVVGAFEPLIPSPTNSEQLSFAVVLVSGSLHGMQYLGIIFATGRRRYGSSPEGTLAARLGRAPLITYGLLVAVSGVYLVVNACRGAAPDIAFFPFDSDAARIFLALYWGGALHHYYLDQKIWHPRRDPVLRRELGLADTAVMKPVLSRALGLALVGALAFHTASKGAAHVQEMLWLCHVATALMALGLLVGWHRAVAGGFLLHVGFGTVGWLLDRGGDP